MNKGILPQEFIDSIVDGPLNVHHLCGSCNNVPICMINSESVITFEETGVAQATITCPYFISLDEIENIYEERRKGQDNSGENTSS